MEEEPEMKLWSVAILLKRRGHPNRLVSGWRWALTGDDAVSATIKACAQDLKYDWKESMTQVCEIPSNTFWK